MTRNHVIAALSVVVSAGLAATACIAAEPKVTETIVTYDVTGKTPAELLASIRKLGPYGEREKRRVHAYTKWQVKWGFLARDAPQGCDVADVVTLVDVTITMPKLKVDATTPKRFVESFSTYYDQMMEHEKGHAKNGVEVAKLIDAALRKIPRSGKKCAELMKVADEIGPRIVKETGDVLDREYDARTAHGALQGVKFPQ